MTASFTARSPVRPTVPLSSSAAPSADERAILAHLATHTYEETEAAFAGWSRGRIYALALRTGARKNELRIQERAAERRCRQEATLRELLGHTATADALDFLDGIPDDSVRCVVTSPPYNLGRGSKRYGNAIGADALRPVMYAGWLQCVVSELARVVRPGGTVFLQVGQTLDYTQHLMPMDVLLFEAMRQSGLTFQSRVAWIKEHGLTPTNRLAERYETALIFSKGETPIFNPGAARTPQKQPGKRAYRGERRGQLSGSPLGAWPSNVWHIPSVRHNHPDRAFGEHPAQFPLALARRAVLLYSQPGDLVLDPFSGSWPSRRRPRGARSSAPICSTATRAPDVSRRRARMRCRSCPASRMPRSRSGRPRRDASMSGPTHATPPLSSRTSPTSRSSHPAPPPSTRSAHDGSHCDGRVWVRHRPDALADAATTDASRPARAAHVRGVRRPVRARSRGGHGRAGVRTDAATGACRTGGACSRITAFRRWPFSRVVRLISPEHPAMSELKLALITTDGLAHLSAAYFATPEKAIAATLGGDHNSVFTVNSARNDGGTLVGFEVARDTQPLDEDDSDGPAQFDPSRSVVVRMPSGALLGATAPLCVVAFGADGVVRDLDAREQAQLRVSHSDTALVLQVA
jgi:DNA modification methylase